MSQDKQISEGSANKASRVRSLGLRAGIISLLFLLTALGLHTLDETKKVSTEKPLETFPKAIGKWQAQDNQRLDEQVAQVLGVDDYVYRNYISPQGESINLYGSYFSYTDRTKGYHSPLNCMPGSGWNIASTKPVSIELRNSPVEEVTVNRMVLQQGNRLQVSLYWYQCRGRIMHSEYEERIYRVIDSIFQGRTDGSFIRLIANSQGGSVESETEKLKTFATKIIPLLREYIPE